MALSKNNLAFVLEYIFSDRTGKSDGEKAQELADTIDAYIKTAIAQVSIPPGTVITAVTGGSGAPAVGTPNPAPITLTGDPDDPGPNAGGLS